MSHRITRRAVALVVLALGCKTRAASSPPRIPVTVARAELQAVPFEITATGNVEPRQTASVQSQVTGIITNVAFHEGDDVTTGQLLFQIDPRPLQAALDQARAVLARDLAQAQNAQLEADRYGQLVQQDYVTKQDYDEKRSTAAALAATVRADSAMVSTAALNLAWASIRAPIPGRTGRLLVRAGNLVRANTDPLVVINQIHPILVRFAVPSQQLSGVQRYRGNKPPVLVSPSTGDTTVLQGVLTFVDNTVDTTTGTVLLKAEFSNTDNALWPGEFVSVRLRLYVQDSALVIPTQAVMSGQQGTYVFVVNQEGIAQSQPVTVARSSGTHAVISQGIHAGDEVVTDGQLRLSPGAAVEIKGGDSAGGQIEANR